MEPKIELTGAVIVVSDQPARLANWYRDVLAIKLADEQHDDDALHYGGYIGPNHFAIHPPANFSYAPATDFGSIRIALHTFDFEGMVARLRSRNVTFLLEPVDLGWSKMAVVTDPDGNAIEILQGSEDHLRAAAVRYRAAAAKIEKHLGRGA